MVIALKHETVTNWPWRVLRRNRALELAIKHQKHVDTVLGYRQKYLQQLSKIETDKRFDQYSREVFDDSSRGKLSNITAGHQVGEINWDAIHAKKDQERVEERDQANISSRK